MIQSGAQPPLPDQDVDNFCCRDGQEGDGQEGDGQEGDGQEAVKMIKNAHFALGAKRGGAVTITRVSWTNKKMVTK